MNHEIEKYPGELRELRLEVSTLREHMRPCDRDVADVELGRLTPADDLAGEYPAKYTVFWPGQTVHACQRHFDGLKQLNAVMGGATLDYREEGGNQCSNCVNEAKKKGD